MHGQPRFGVVTHQQVIGALKATGSTDPDVLAAAIDQFAAPYRPLKWFGIWGMVTGALCTAFIILAFIGIPVFIFGVWAFRRSKKNIRTIEEAYAEYRGKLGAASASTPLVSGELRAMGLGLLALATVAGDGWTQVPGDFHGDWVSTKATCDAPLRFRVDATSFTLINGKDQQVVRGIEMAGPAYFGPGYSGIQAVAISEFEGDQPVTAVFNYQEKKGAAWLEYTELTGTVHAAYQPQAARLKKLNLSQRFPLKDVVLKHCGAKGGGAGPPARATGTATAATAPTAAVEDFRVTTSGGTRYAAVLLRITNKRAEPLVLGYVQGSGIVTDDRGNRYMVSGPVRGIGEINASTFDPKFVLQPGETRDARFEFAWNRQNQIFGTTFTMDLALRELVPVGANQYTLGQESVLRFEGLQDMTSGPAAASSGTPAPKPSTPAASGAATTPADPCGSDPRCSFAGPFAANVTELTASRSGNYQFVKLNVRFTNLGGAPVILCYSGRSSTGSDDRGNRFGIREPQGVRGIGTCAGGVADPQFALQPGQSREASFEYATGIYGGTVLGTVWTMGLTVQQLELLAGNQVQTKSEYLVSFRDLTDGTGPSSGAPAASASTAGTTRAEGTACAGKQWCDDAGIFVAQVTRVTPSRATNWQLFALNIKVKNMLEEPIILCAVSGSGLGTDENGNRYNVRSLKGMGTCTNTQFALQPGESRDIAVEYASGIYRGTLIGVEWKADFTLQRLQTLPGNQTQAAGDYAVSFSNLKGGGAGAASTSADAAGVAASGAKGLLDTVLKKK